MFSRAAIEGLNVHADGFFYVKVNVFIRRERKYVGGGVFCTLAFASCGYSYLSLSFVSSLQENVQRVQGTCPTRC